jgi:DNA/RNA endonuclease YhcR with UshA esterase domain
MISDSDLMKISLFISIIGVIALFFIVQFIGPVNVEVVDITREMDGQIIVTEGMINSIAKNDGNFFFSIGDGEEIDVVMFESIAKKNDFIDQIKEGDLIKVKGQVSIYRNELEIIAEEISKI